MEHLQLHYQCHCSILPTRLHEFDMPAGATSPFAKLNDSPEFISRCALCKQCWQFCYYGREEIPTFEKIGRSDANRKVAAWNAAKPEREAEAARWAEQSRVCETKLDAAFAKAAQSEAIKRTPLSRILQIGSILLILTGVGFSFSLMLAGGDLEPRSLVIAGGAFFTGLILAAWFAWRIR